MALTRAPENIGGNHDISFEAPFTLRLAGHIDMLFFRCFCLQSPSFCLLFGWMLFLAESLSSLWKYFLLCKNTLQCLYNKLSSHLAANCVCSWAPCLFDSKSRLIKFLSSFHAVCNQGELTFFILSKGIDNAQSFLGYVLPTKFFFRIRFLQNHVHIRYRRDHDKQNAVVVV